MRNALKPIVGFKPPRQLCMVLDSLELRGLRAAERSTVILSVGAPPDRSRRRDDRGERR
jgi:hypothetical protein